MPFYHRAGQVPHKRHTVFRRPDGRLYPEELVSTEGFSSVYSLVYHCHPPTRIREVGAAQSVAPRIAIANNPHHRSFRGFQVAPADDYLQSRQIVLTNNDCQIILAAPRQSMDYFYKNATGDEMLFIHEGSGTVSTAFGNLRFTYGDYVHIPRGVIYRIDFDTEDNRLFIVESFSPIQFPRKYLSREGQLLEHSPFCERDIRVPSDLVTHDQRGEFPIFIKKYHDLFRFVYDAHPFDYIGWDGFFYPYSMSIHDFEPITGRVHQPPPVHQHFEAHNFVICSFVPRLFDYHPEAIPAPYNHSNVDSDEVLYYVDGDFMSRNNIERGQITLHPIGIPHGPHPGAAERSIGVKDTQELAVMVDTFKPLALTQEALAIEDPSYLTSWLED
jgi:homogentisate 1,2-dioxygenase